LSNRSLKFKCHTCPAFATTFPALSAFLGTTFSGTKLAAFSGTTFSGTKLGAFSGTTLGEVRMEKILAGKRRVKD